MLVQQASTSGEIANDRNKEIFNSLVAGCEARKLYKKWYKDAGGRKVEKLLVVAVQAKAAEMKALPRTLVQECTASRFQDILREGTGST